MGVLPDWRIESGVAMRPFAGGRVTSAISTTTPLPAKMDAGEGIAQILFLEAEAVRRTRCADQKGQYQDQKGLTLPLVLGPKPTT